MANIKSIINMHNKEVITEKNINVKCNCINKPNCPLSNQCKITNIIYKAKITSNLHNYHEKMYYGTSEGTFKQRYGNQRNHSIMKNIRQIHNFRRNTGDLNNSKQPTKRTGICYLCLNEKLFIIEHQGNDLLNQRNELNSKCRHRNKFKLMNHKT